MIKPSFLRVLYVCWKYRASICLRVRFVYSVCIEAGSSDSRQHTLLSYIKVLIISQTRKKKYELLMAFYMLVL